MDRERGLREQVVALLGGEQAHMGIAAAVKDFPEGMINARPPRVEYTFWHLIEHLRITQLDILKYLKEADYQELEWPREYWPAPEATTDKTGWDASVAAFERDLAEVIAIVSDPATDLFAGVPSNPQHNVLREALIVADHNAYHIGELGILRQVMNAWGPGHD